MNNEEQPLQMPKGRLKISFCENYAVLHNGSKAAIKAGYSEKASRQIAWNLLQEPEVKAYISYLEKERLAEANIQAVDVLLELKKIAFSNLEDFIEFKNEYQVEEPNPKYDPDKEEGWMNEPNIQRTAGGLVIKDFDKLSKDQLAAISEFSEAPTAFGKNRKIKLHSKLDALSQIRAMQGLDEPKRSEKKLEVNIPNNLEHKTFSLKTRNKKQDES